MWPPWIGGTKGQYFIVDREWEGVSVGKEEPKMGIRCSNTTEVILDDVRVHKNSV